MMEYGKKWFERAMTEPEINSRIVFLLQGAGTALAVAALAVAFIFVHDKTAYPTFMTTVVGGGLGSAVGRTLTKFGTKYGK